MKRAPFSVDRRRTLSAGATALAGLAALAALGPTSLAVAQGGAVSWPAPALTDENYRHWLSFIRPSAEELKWRKVRWHPSLAAAAREARELQRPILLWTMNGHPCGET